MTAGRFAPGSAPSVVASIVDPGFPGSAAAAIAPSERIVSSSGMTNVITASGHTTPEGLLNLSLKVGVNNADVAVVVQIQSRPPASRPDPNGWPEGYFERCAGSMPELTRPPQGDFEERPALG